MNFGGLWGSFRDGNRRKSHLQKKMQISLTLSGHSMKKADDKTNHEPNDQKHLMEPYQ